jgi:hypothetical protein
MQDPTIASQPHPLIETIHVILLAALTFIEAGHLALQVFEIGHTVGWW